MRDLIQKATNNFLFFYKHLGRKIFYSLGLNVFVGLLDGVGLAIFIPLLEITNDNNSSSDTSQRIQYFMNYLGIDINLNNVLFILVFTFILKGSARFSAFYYRVWLGEYFIKNIRGHLIRSFNNLRYNYFESMDNGRILNSFTAEVARVTNAFSGYVKIIEGFSLVFTYAVLAFSVDFQFATLVVIFGGIGNLIFLNLNKRTRLYSKVLVSKNNIFHGLITEYVYFFKYLFVSSKIKSFSNKIIDSINEVETTNRKIGFVNALVTSLKEPVMIIILVIVILIQIHLLSNSLSSMLISILFFYRALQSLLQLQNNWNSFLANEGSLKNIQNFITELSANQEKHGTFSIKKFSKEIRLENLNYSIGSKKIITNINFKIKKNETITIVGPSGSGKTTLINLISGLLPTKQNSILIDDISIDQIDKNTYQNLYGYLTQDTVIFKDSVFNNVTLWDTKNKKNLRAFNKVLKEADLLQFMTDNKLNEDSILENSGSNLSGGQKQRISIARELYKNSEILILDEATSALDKKTESHIEKTLRNLKGTKTIIIITHKKDFTLLADRTIELKNGQLLKVSNNGMSKA